MTIDQRATQSKSFFLKRASNLLVRATSVSYSPLSTVDNQCIVSLPMYSHNCKSRRLPDRWWSCGCVTLKRCAPKGGSSRSFNVNEMSTNLGMYRGEPDRGWPDSVDPQQNSLMHIPHCSLLTATERLFHGLGFWALIPNTVSPFPLTNDFGMILSRKTPRSPACKWLIRRNFNLIYNKTG